MSTSDLFAPCPGYLPLVPESEHDCAACLHQYAERACPEFRERFLRTLCRELELELHEMRFAARTVGVGG